MNHEPLIALESLALRMTAAELTARQVTPAAFTSRQAELYLGLRHQLADSVLLDDLGSTAIDRPVAKRLLAEHQARVAAKAEADRERRERETAERERAAEQEQADQAARKARAERQRQMLTDNPELDALSLMRMEAGDDGGLGYAGRQHDAFIRPEKTGVLEMHSFTEGR